MTLCELPNKGIRNLNHFWMRWQINKKDWNEKLPWCLTEWRKQMMLVRVSFCLQTWNYQCAQILQQDCGFVLSDHGHACVPSYAIVVMFMVQIIMTYVLDCCCCCYWYCLSPQLDCSTSSGNLSTVLVLLLGMVHYVVQQLLCCATIE